MNDLFYNVNDEARLRGYTKDGEFYKCLFCSFDTEQGMIYPAGDLFMDAQKAIKTHIEQVHGGVFDYLMSLGKKETGISDHQKSIVNGFFEKMSDYQIQESLNIGSVSTIRNHRHNLKEKEKQAKTFLTIMSLLNKNTNKSKAHIKPHPTATMLDKRYDITSDDIEKTIEKYFPDGPLGRIKHFNMKEKQKIIVLREAIKRFDLGKEYSQRDVDSILKGVYADDYVLLRRYLIEYGFLDRTKDCKSYWVKESKEKAEKSQMTNRKKALKEKYAIAQSDSPIISGVYQIKNTINGKIFVGSTRNIDNMNRIAFQLKMGSFINRQLQKDYNEIGEDGFELTILEKFDEDADVNDPRKTLIDLERKWKEKLSPYGDQGYHRKLKS